MSDAEESVTQIRTLEAPADKVFAAWIDGAQLQRWLAPIAKADGRVAGRFRLEVRTPEGSHVVTGEYRELVPARRIVMTWVYEGPMPAGRLDRGAGAARFAPERAIPVRDRPTMVATT